MTVGLGAPVVRTSCGGLAVSRLPYTTELVLDEVIASEYMPSALKPAGAIGTSTHVFTATAPIVPSCAPRDGLLLHVIAVSDQSPEIAKIVPPTGLASVT